MFDIPKISVYVYTCIEYGVRLIGIDVNCAFSIICGITHL